MKKNEFITISGELADCPHDQPTPGPWGPYRNPNCDDPWILTQGTFEAAPGLSIGSIHHTEPICRVSGYLLPALRNAKLIAAAPEMLAALVEIRLLSSWPVIGGEHGKIVKLAEVAIKKALDIDEI